MVEQTQGGYDQNNHAAWMANPVFKPLAQFRKFSVTYGQQFYRNLMWGFTHQDPKQRKESRKAVRRLLATSVLFAGLGGTALTEIVKHTINALAGLGLMDDDWDETETNLQRVFGDIIEWASGSDAAGDVISEMLFKGVSRAINLDLSNAMGADSLFLFGQPKTWDEQGVMEYIGKLFIGAPGDTAIDTAKAAFNMDRDGIPWPKMISNLKDAIELTDGITNKAHRRAV
jgi:hypothetical protein